MQDQLSGAGTRTTGALDPDGMFDLAHRLAVAKSAQDVPAALALLHATMVLECPPFGSVAEGLPANEAALERFFGSFPDYHVELDGHASDGEQLICWGTARMTMTGDRFGVRPNGRPATVDVFIQFRFRDRLIAGERFSFDLASLCAQSGVSTDAVRDRLFPGASR